jgi:hypothetical protein
MDESYFFIAVGFSQRLIKIDQLALAKIKKTGSLRARPDTLKTLLVNSQSFNIKQ